MDEWPLKKAVWSSLQSKKDKMTKVSPCLYPKNLCLISSLLGMLTQILARSILELLHLVQEHV